jgi:hypothetical protein
MKKNSIKKLSLKVQVIHHLSGEGARIKGGNSFDCNTGDYTITCNSACFTLICGNFSIIGCNTMDNGGCYSLNCYSVAYTCECSGPLSF